MISVFDTSSLSVFRNYYPSAFPSFWTRLDALVADGSLISVREVYAELENDNRVAFVHEWAKDNKAVFAIPTDEEFLVVRDILAISHFQAVISEKALLKGTPVADPFLVAKASVDKATLITEEAVKPNAAKIPNICEAFDVECHNLEWFMEQHNLSF